MKKIILFLLIPVCFQTKAQSNYPQSNYYHQRQQNNQQQEDKLQKKGFQKDKLFTGGSVNLGLSSYSTSLGIAPQLGYSLTNWLDAGVVFNLNYISQRDYYNYGDKLRQTVYGPGAFVRIFPVNFLFATAQYEYNFIHTKYIPADGSPSQISTVNANSLLLGLGYAGGRYRGNNTYYFLSVSWDVLGDVNSPYVDGLGRSFPVIRAGYNFGLFQGRYRRSNNSYYNKPDDGYYNR
ncbi:MAG TPA: hypothetical protein VMU83_06385 [Hanamia sp.]|nr:hypothetical protein [Hanamia sp.]